MPFSIDQPINLFFSIELTHLVVKWSAVRNQSEIETSLKMRGMSPFLFVKLVQQRRTQNHAKPAHRVRRSSGQPFTGTTRSAGVRGFGLALAILVGLAKKWCCAAFLYISCQPFFTTKSLSSPRFFSVVEVSACFWTVPGRSAAELPTFICP